MALRCAIVNEKAYLIGERGRERPSKGKGKGKGKEEKEEEEEDGRRR